MTRVARVRRLAVASTALAIAAVLFRSPVASSLVTRGDELLGAGAPAAALAAYRRALRLDPGSAAAADRLAFWLLRERDPRAASVAFEVAGAAIAKGARDAALYADRGLAAARLARWAAAERDLRRAAADARDPRYAHLAARMAQRDRRPERMQRDLALALAIDPDYAPARKALGRRR